MIRKLLLLATIMGATHLANAQAFPKGSFNVCLGYGFGNLSKSLMKSWDNNTDFKMTLIGPLHGKFEYMIGEKFGIGLSLNYISLKGTYSIQYYNSSSQLVSGQEGIKFNSLSGLLRANYYWLNSDKFGLYSGLGLGYRSGSWSYFSDDPGVGSMSFPTSFPLGLEGILGTKVLFTDNLGVYAEVGVAKSIAQIGVVYTMGGDK